MRFVVFLLVTIAFTLASTVEPAQVQDPAKDKGGKKGAAGQGGFRGIPVDSFGSPKKQKSTNDSPDLQTTERSQAQVDEQIIRSAGLSTDGDALLTFFRERMEPKADLNELLIIARKLGAADPQIQAKAAATLVARGSVAAPALRHVLNEMDNFAAAEQARHCLQWI